MEVKSKKIRTVLAQLSTVLSLPSSPVCPPPQSALLLSLPSSPVHPATQAHHYKANKDYRPLLLAVQGVSTHLSVLKMDFWFMSMMRRVSSPQQHSR